MSRGENPFFALLVAVTCSFALVFPSHRRIVEILLTFGLVANVMPAFGLAMFAVTARQDAGNDASPTRASFTLPVDADTPNIFHIIVDGYARDDVMLRLLGYDNGGCLDALDARGFYVARQSYANYPSTFLSLASTVAMDYVVTDETPPFRSRLKFYDAIQGNNPAVQRSATVQL